MHVVGDEEGCVANPCKHHGRLQIGHINELGLLLEARGKGAKDRALYRKDAMEDGQPTHESTNGDHTARSGVISQSQDVLEHEDCDIG